MDKVFIFKLGSFVANALQPVVLYIPIINDQFPAMDRAVDADSDVEGLRLISAQFPGYNLFCEPKLAEAGASFEFTPEPLTDAAKRLRADIALSLTENKYLAKLASSLFHELFLQACSYFIRYKPWENIALFQLIKAEVSGEYCEKNTSQLYEITISKPSPSRLTLYEQAGGANLLFQLMEEGRSQETLRVDRIILSFEDDKDFVISALQEGYGLPYLPKPIKLKGGEKHQIDEEDAFHLMSIMYAIVDLANGNLVELPDGKIVAASRVTIDDENEILAEAWFGEIIQLGE